jgi:hypothetical protein
MTRAKAIKKHCFECAGESSKEVVGCELTDCPLWPYRLGNSPGSKAYQERLKNYGFLPTSINKTTHSRKNDG